MVAESISLAVVLIAMMAEWLHHRRCARLGRLAFGPTARPRIWVRFAAPLRVAACGALAWGLISLWQLDPKVHSGHQLDEKKLKHLVFVLDVSPSMYLQDAGPELKLTRRKRASDVVTSLLQRLPLREYRVSLVGFYSDAKLMLEESSDVEILRYLLEDLPTYLGFQPGKTDLFAGLRMAAQMAAPWHPGSATVVILTDGMTVPATGMPRMPSAVSKILIVGIGDPNAGRFIDGHQSRQDVATLRQVAARLGGLYHNGNTKHIASNTIHALRALEENDKWGRWGRREWSLAAIGLSAAILSILPLLLHALGTNWSPGVKSSTNEQRWANSPSRNIQLANPPTIAYVVDKHSRHSVKLEQPVLKKEAF